MWRNKSRLARLAFVTAIISGLLFGGIKIYATDNPSAWFGASNPEFAVNKALVSDAEYPATYVQRGNIDCSNLSFTHRDGDAAPLLPLHKESIRSGCYISTLAGQIDTNGLMNVSGTNYVADLVRPDGSPTSFFAFPNSDLFVSNAASTNNGVNVWFDHLGTSLVYAKDNLGKIKAVVTPHAQTLLSDKSGNKLTIADTNFGVSDNGTWAVIQSPGHGFLRINLETMEVLPFGDLLLSDGSTGTSPRLSISSDGRYAAVAVKNYSYFKLFDLSTCGTVPATITTPLACQSRDLQTFLRTKITNLSAVLQIRFMTNNLIKIYASYDSSTKIGQYTVAAPGTSLTGIDYLALGDSFSSGEGAHKYEIGTDVKDINMCHLSTVSFPYIIARNLSLNGFHSVACSGATIANIKGGSGISDDKSKKNRDNQYDDLPSQSTQGTWLPGYSKQIKFVSENAPHLITVSALGNDLGFSDLVTNCVGIGTCYPNYEDRIEFLNQVDGKLTTLVNMYKKLKTTAPSDAKIYAVAYPKIALHSGSCGLNVHMNESELQFADMIINRINIVIKTAATQAGINFADIEDALIGYRLCEGDSGNIGMNGLTAGTDVLHIIGNESFHPNEFGQFLMAQKILGITNNLGTLNPLPTTASLPVITGQEPALSNTKKTNRVINKLLNFTPETKVIRAGKNIKANLNGLSNALPSGANFTVKLDGLNIGTATTDTDGNLPIDVVIPASTTDGIHVVDIYGNDATGQPINATATIATTSSDNTQTCGSISLSGNDVDKDGIDDACDPLIGPAPTPVTPIFTEPTPPSEELTEQVLDTIKEPSNSTSIFADEMAQLRSPAEAGQLLEKNEDAKVLSSKTSASSTVFKTKNDNLVADTRQALNSQFSDHPLRYIAAMLAFTLALVILGLQRRFDHNHPHMYIDNTPHRLHV